MDYEAQCQAGEDAAKVAATEAAQSGNLPKLVGAIREAAKRGDGYEAGFMYALGSLAMGAMQ